jgi:hypothetical protein
VWLTLGLPPEQPSDDGALVRFARHELDALDAESAGLFYAALRAWAD